MRWSVAKNNGETDSVATGESAVAAGSHATRASGQVLLEVSDVHKRFGGVAALRGVSFEVLHGEVLGLIGPNGSGKSTCVNVISGLVPPTSGSIRFLGEPVAGSGIERMVGRGLARTFQTTSVFSEFTAIENVLAASHIRFGLGAVRSVLGRAAAAREQASLRERGLGILELVGLGSVAEVPAASLSSAQQRLLMIANALATEPRLILLDEPAAGMVSSERAALASLILRIRDRGVGVLVIEHHMALIMEVCDRIVVLNFGEKIAEGERSQIGRDPRVIEAYLGQAH